MEPHITINRYLDKLAARSPAPGGGSAAALTGALGISLLSMAVRFLLKREVKRPSRIKLLNILRFTERTRRRLIKLMSEDETAYLRLSKGIRRKTEKNITKLYKGAADVPFEVCTLLESGLKMCEELCHYCKTAIITDLVEAALLLEAGFSSAKINVEINFAGIKDTLYIKGVKGILLRQEKAVVKAKKRILKITDVKIKGLR